jgi:hypothetical protein
MGRSNTCLLVVLSTKQGELATMDNIHEGKNDYHSGASVSA